jgi:hypothetical protein
VTTYTEQLQRIWRSYEEAGMPTPVTARDVAAWAVAQNLWEPRRADITRNARMIWPELFAKNTEPMHEAVDTEPNMPFESQEAAFNMPSGRTSTRPLDLIWSGHLLSGGSK